MAAGAITAEEYAGGVLVRKQTSLWADGWRRLRRNRLALASSIYLGVLALMAIIALRWTPSDPNQIALLNPYDGPTWQHLFGADHLGRDLLSRFMIGAQISLIVGVGTQVIVLAVGVPLGLAAGYFRGGVDTVLSLIINVFYGIPDLLLAMMLVVLLPGGPSIGKIIVAVAATRWMDMARLVRGQALSLREREFVEAAKSSGAKPTRIVFGHLLPNSMGPIIVQATIGIPSAILFEAFLSFLGLGVKPPTPSWGSMASDGVNAIRLAPHILLPPALGLVCTLLAFNFLGDGLRDAFDPRQKR